MKKYSNFFLLSCLFPNHFEYFFISAHSKRTFYFKRLSSILCNATLCFICYFSYTCYVTKDWVVFFGWTNGQNIWWFHWFDQRKKTIYFHFGELTTNLAINVVFFENRFEHPVAMKKGNSICFCFWFVISFQIQLKLNITSTSWT